jgi:hypothetical protein
MDTSASNRRLRTLLTGIRSGELEPRPDFQRRLVWNNKDKNLFIQTVLEGLPFPEIYIAAGKVDSKTGEGSEVLVDGQQRITTLYQYFLGSKDLRLSEDTTPYSELPEERQIDFLEYKVVVRDLGALPLEQIKEVFQRINSASYGLNAMELNNARYGGAFKQLAEELASHKVIEELAIFSANDVRRMNDVRYSVAMLASVLGPYFNRDKEIEGFLARFNEEVPDGEAIRERSYEVLGLIDHMNFPRTARVGKKSDFFTLYVELYKAMEAGVSPEPSPLRAKLDGFYAAVDDASSEEDSDAGRYYRASLQASNDRSSRVLRGELIAAIIREAANESRSSTAASSR